MEEITIKRGKDFLFTIRTKNGQESERVRQRNLAASELLPVLEQICAGLVDEDGERAAEIATLKAVIAMSNLPAEVLESATFKLAELEPKEASV
jgi:hypothetical protein